MRIAVCLKHVPDPLTVEVDPLTGAIDPSRLLYILNPADEAALEVGLRLSPSVQALTVGPPSSAAALRDALAVGASQVARLWDVGWTITHPALTARLLAAALRRPEPSDLVLCGTRSADQGSGLVPIYLAEYLGWPVVTDVVQLEVATATARVLRRLARGAREAVEVRLPAVLAVEAGVASLRYASLTGHIAAQRAAIPVQGLADLGLTAGDLPTPPPAQTTIVPPRPRARAIFTPDSALPPDERIRQILAAGVTRASGQVLEGPPDQMAQAILAFLRARGLLDSPMLASDL